jgi:hypothetical protein
MLTYPTLARPSRRTFSLALPLVLVIAACGTAAAPSRQPTPNPTPNPTPTTVPGVGAEPGGNGAGSGGNTGGGSEPGQPGQPGIGIDLPFPIPPNPADDPLFGDATQVVPVPGRLDPHPVNVQLVRAAIDDDEVWVEIRWYSGVEECYATDSVQVDRDDAAKTINLTVLEGSTGGDVMCIEIAVLKATLVNLGDLDAGTWTISAEGDAPSFELEVG